jgi:hypothetical protein
MKRRLYLLIVLLFSCEKEGKLIFHKFNEEGQTLVVDKMNNAYNYILYIGKDTTLYSMNNDESQVPYNYFYQPLFIPDGLDTLRGQIKNIDFKVFVDTSSSVLIPFYPDVPEDMPGPQISDWRDKNTKMVNAYPVYIWNPTSEITSIGVQGVTTEIIQEAKDEKGNWRPIEYWVSGFCGNGKWKYILEPNYYVITSVYKYSGEFETDLRVKFKRGNSVYYSNKFRGKINRHQFNPPEYANSPRYFLEKD